ncbi:MAG: hypothetical protein DHS20C11_34260 [Lysobacteraceae bacterium]|nr:MAG: hypothetical protein DHS20C11_34260 [Xanthomonadaceae bacterium]
MSELKFSLKRKSRIGERHARKLTSCAVVITRAGRLWQSVLVDISATGMSIETPLDWSARLKQTFRLEIVTSPGNIIQLEAKLVRDGDGTLAFDFSRIPEDMEVPLWEFLGKYADQKEHLY